MLNFHLSLKKQTIKWDRLLIRFVDGKTDNIQMSKGVRKQALSYTTSGSIVFLEKQFSSSYQKLKMYIFFNPAIRFEDFILEKGA